MRSARLASVVSVGAMVWPGQHTYGGRTPGPAPAPDHGSNPAPRRRRVSSASSPFVPPRQFISATSPGDMGPNKVASMQHVQAAGHTSGLVGAGIGDIMSHIEAGTLTKAETIAQLGQLQSAAAFTSEVVKASAGKLTTRGKDTWGIGGGFVAERVNSRALADQARENEISGSGGDPPDRSLLSTITNILAHPERHGVKEETAALRVKPGKPKPWSDLPPPSRHRRKETARQKVSIVAFGFRSLHSPPQLGRPHAGAHWGFQFSIFGWCCANGKSFCPLHPEGPPDPAMARTGEQSMSHRPGSRAAAG